MNTPRFDRIEIKDLRVRCIIGINDDERTHAQDVLINITLHADIRHAAQSDQIGDTVNYRTLTKVIIELVEHSQYFLVETLADRVAQLCLREPGVQQVEVSVEKPGALRFARSVGVGLMRTRDDYVPT